jgi:hypothetical protein
MSFILLINGFNKNKKEVCNMHSDSIYIKGKSHKVCQDYAATRDNFQSSRAAISDGCSSSKDTDIGARIIVQEEIQKLFNAEVEYIRVGSRKEMLDATLLSIHVVDSISYVKVVGDGVVAIKRMDGSVSMYRYYFPGGYPMYMSYTWDEKRYAMLSSEQKELYVDCIDILQDGRVIDRKEIGPLIFENNYDAGFPIHEPSEIEFVAVFSDGVESFTDKEGNKIDCFEIVKELMAFKNYAGEFVTRRMNGFLRGCEKKGWSHYDDLSMAAIYMGEEK